VRCDTRPSLDDLNGLAARALATALLPARWRPTEASGEGARSPASLFVDTAARLCAHPSQRLLTLLSVPQMPARSVDFTTFTWPALLKRLRQMLITGTRRRRGRAGWLHGLYATR
jgi:tubulin delta